jgi:hypothetical protein
MGVHGWDTVMWLERLHHCEWLWRWLWLWYHSWRKIRWIGVFLALLKLWVLSICVGWETKDGLLVVCARSSKIGEAGGIGLISLLYRGAVIRQDVVNDCSITSKATACGWGDRKLCHEVEAPLLHAAFTVWDVMDVHPFVTVFRLSGHGDMCCGYRGDGLGTSIRPNQW